MTAALSLVAPLAIVVGASAEAEAVRGGGVALVARYSDRVHLPPTSGPR